jgi:hypothetical protein
MEIVGKREECTQNDVERTGRRGHQITRSLIAKEASLKPSHQQNLIENDWATTLGLIEMTKRIERGI